MERNPFEVILQMALGMLVKVLLQIPHMDC